MRSGKGEEENVKIHIVKPGKNRAELIRVTQLRSLPCTASCSKHSDIKSLLLVCVFSQSAERICTSKTSWRKSLGERFSHGGNYLSPTTHTRSYAAAPEMFLSLFWLSIGMAFVSSRLVCQSLSFIFALAAFFFLLFFLSRRVTKHTFCPSRRFSSLSESSRVYVPCNLSTGSRRTVCLSLDDGDSNVNRDSAIIFCLVDRQRRTQVVIFVYERKTERKKKKENEMKKRYMSFEKCCNSERNEYERE